MSRPIPGQLAFDDEFLSAFELKPAKPVLSLAEGTTDDD